LITSKVANIGAIENGNSLISAEIPSELTVTDINCYDFLCSSTEKDIGETTSGRSGIKTDFSLNVHFSEDIKCTSKFMTASRDEVISIPLQHN
jgi:hypothetical protein